MGKLKNIFGIRSDGEAPIYNIFVGQTSVTMGVQIDKFIPRGQTWRDYGGEKRPTYVMVNPFNPSKEHSVVGVDDTRQIMLPITFNGQPRDNGGYTARVIFQDYAGNRLINIIPPELENALDWYKSNYFIIRKHVSKYLKIIENRLQSPSFDRKDFLNEVKEFKSAFYQPMDNKHRDLVKW